MRELSAHFRPYEWAISTAEAARIAGIRPEDVLRFDANTAPGLPRAARPAAVSRALARVNGYPHGGYPELVAAIAEYAGAEPDNVVLGAGADDLILLAARTFAGPGDRVAIVDEPTYPLYRVAAWLAGAEVGGAGCGRPRRAERRSVPARGARAVRRGSSRARARASALSDELPLRAVRARA